MPIPWEAERRAVLETAQAMAGQGLVTGASGNVSLRLPSHEGRELLAVTPSQRPYHLLGTQDILVIDFEGEPVEGDLVPSTESLLHIGVYRHRSDVRAVVHTHSIYASVCAVTGLELPPVLDELMVVVGGPVQVAEYGFPGTAELAQRAVAALGERKAVFLRHHGMVGVGKSLQEALDICALVERAAQVFVLASLLDRAHSLPAAVVEMEQELYRMRRRAEG
ncbi:MAG: class II aldolase/adducin family protein [Chloroflexi bacterium]|nr:class II aldolase/adducin family protein [Chloroflexota bacterium]